MDGAIFLVAAALSLSSSVVLVARLERLGERLGLAEALLGLVVALAADGPEIISALTAAATGQRTVGVGVILGSNAFNLAALLGLSALVAGRLRLPRPPVMLEGTLALAIAFLAVAVVAASVDAFVGLILALCVFLPYVLVAALPAASRARLPLRRSWLALLRRAIEQEEADAQRPLPGDRRDAAMAVLVLVVVVGASVAMEQSAVTLGTAAGVPAIILGGLVLAAVTSLPNAVAAVYLARRGRGIAAMSAAFHSNTFNVLVGLLLPATLVGLGPATREVPVVAMAYLALTVMVVALAWQGRGLGRRSGVLIIAGYATYVAYLLTM